MKKPANHSRYRVHPQAGLNFDEITVDNFAGGGGASMGIELGLGRPVDIAINHDIDAIRMHEVNHPHTRHFCESVWDVDPVEVTQGRPVGLAWFSPDCKHFSKARGAVPVSKKIRGLAWVALKWAATVKPRVIMLENVEEFVTWGPVRVDDEGNCYPCPKRKGQTFQAFKNALARHGYQVEHRELRACDYGAPTSRKRFFLIARCDGQPIVWPAPTHGKGLLPYRTAADIIDWSIPCPSIFERKKPLADATLRRIAEGLRRFVVESPNPFIVPIANYNGRNTVHDLNEPLRTITAHPKGGAFAMCTPYLQAYYGQKRPGEVRGGRLEEPVRTVTTENRHALVTAFIAKHYTGVIGHDLREPLHTITSVDHHAEVRAFLVKYYSEGGQWAPLDEPMHTIPTKDRLGLVMVKGDPYRIVDIGMRMLSPRELFNAQGFPADYIIEHDGHGKIFTKTAQVARCGNSVCPPLSEALVRANMGQMAQQVAA